MDVFSHGLWGGITVGRRNKKSFLTAVAIGMAPDVIAFGPFLASRLLDQGWGFFSQVGHKPELATIPQYVHSTYNVTHSLVVFATAFLIVWAIRRQPMMEMLAWGLHVCMDIPVHSLAFFPTPFLWPLSDFRVDGVPWSRPYIFYPDWALLIILYGWFIYRKRWPKQPAHSD